jgi:two-component system, OmpR family, sensor histidine kinase VicK
LTTTQASPSDVINERTEVLHGEQNVVNTVLQFTSKAKSRIYACVDYTRPSLAVEIEELRTAFLDAKSRGVKLRYITEITKDNVGYCKELLKMVDELRHIEGIKGNFYISETEYIAPATFHEKGKPASQIVYSNVKEIVRQQRQFVFDSFWGRSIPAEQKIKEIEEGIIHYETRIVEDPDQIIEEISRLTANSNELSTCITSGGMQYSYNYFFKIKKKLLEKQKKGKHKGIRYITKIEKDNIDLAKIYMNYGIQIRHVKNLPPMSFGVSDKEMSATIEKMEGGKKIQSLLISTEPSYINHYNSIFDELWKSGIDAAYRIKDIEAGLDTANIEIIQNPKEAIERAWSYLKTARSNVSVLFPTANTFRRQIRMGLLQLLKEATEQRGVQIRILIPASEQIMHIINEAKAICPLVDFRIAEENLQTQITLVLIDKKHCMIVELKDDTRDNSYDAAGLSTYSDSKSIILSYTSIFEILWKQNELYEQLKIHDKMQSEFINIAAHELRTPIQPILGLTEVIRSKIGDREEESKLLNVVSRNAKRLQQLTENILDVTRIESNWLQLSKERFSLLEMVLNAMADCKSQLREYVSIRLELISKEDIYVEGDKARICQVIYNLLNNAIKFTQEAVKGQVGIISVSLEEHAKNNDDCHNNKKVIVSIKDTGVGIAPEIMPRLFSKFTTKSERGTGLGLFISKSIVEAHGGRIWAQNNPDGKGATFAFSLPIVNKK